MVNKRINKYIPYDVFETIYDIDYNKLYENGKKIIIFDVDNTIARYVEKDPSNNALDLISKLKEIGYLIIILSNNNGERIKRITSQLNVLGFYSAQKPFRKGYKKILEFLKNEKICDDFSTCFTIGDQIMTDVLGSNRMKVDAILVKPLCLKDEKWYTKLNRIRERKIIKKIKKHDLNTYNKIMEIRKEEF